MPGRKRTVPTQPKKPKATTRKLEQRQKYYDSRMAGLGKLASASEAGVHAATARKWEEQWLEAGNKGFDEYSAPDPRVRASQISPDARVALAEFNTFQERYLGRIALPWQKDVMDDLQRLSASPEREYVVINVAPGSGKSTTFTHDFLCWMIAKNRGIRICILSSTQNNAEKFADRIRRTLEATVPIQAPEKELRAGISKDAKTTMSKDFGRFKPEEATTWTKQKFFVDRPVYDEGNKDATVEAFGRDQAFLGGRFDIVICDDVYDPKSVKTVEAKNELKQWYSDVAESRLEPAGLMLVVMQRVDADDLSRYCLDMVAYDETEDDTEDAELDALKAEKERLGIDPLPIRDDKQRKYRHFKFQAHFEDECKGPKFHGPSAPAWPEGCLLYPRRLSYRELKTKELQDPGKFKVWYQQEDFEPGNVLVDPVWITGGIDEFGVQRPGCWDKQRSVHELPPNVTSDNFSFISVDPSPSQFWAIQWWIYHAPTKELILMDTLRQRMTSVDFFAHHPQTNEYSGVLTELAQIARETGVPIGHAIVEINAAQKFMYESPAIVDWLRLNGIALMPHTTTAINKNNTEYGVQGLQTWFKEGRVRLPGKDGDALKSYTHSVKLVDEVTKYRVDGSTAYTDDQVMACWFATKAVENLYRPRKELPRKPIPSTVRLFSTRYGAKIA